MTPPLNHIPWNLPKSKVGTAKRDGRNNTLPSKVPESSSLKLVPKTNVDGLRGQSSVPYLHWLLVVVMAALSLYVPAQSPRKILLAVGKGSGSFQLWTCYIKVKSTNKVGSYDAHVQAVTLVTLKEIR